MKKYLVFITDCSDIAYSEMRAIALQELESIAGGEQVQIEPVVSVAPFSIINSCFCLRLLAESYPEGTTFCIVVNPLKERPERILGKTTVKGFTFIGANTGAFHWFLEKYGIKELYELHDPGFIAFGGKHIHAPAAAKIASGFPLTDLGKPFLSEKLRPLDIPEGTIVHIDNFGLMKISAKLPDNIKDGDKLTIIYNQSKEIEAIFCTRMMNRNDGEWVLYPGSSLGLPELGQVRTNGARELDAKIGAMISFKIKKSS